MQKDTREKRKVVFVTKDINLRIKADSIGIDAEDFENDKVSPSDLHVEDGLIENFPGNQIDELYSEDEIPADILKDLYDFPLNANKYFTLKNGSKSTFAFFDYTKNTLRRVEKKKVSGIIPRNSEQVFAIDAILSPKIKLISLFGKAGTGKTLIAMAAALDMLKKRDCNRIIIASANVPLSNKDIGALPGDIDEKVSPYMQGLFDNLAFIKTQLYKKEESDTASKKGRKSLEEPFADETILTKQKPQKTKEKERLDPIGDLLKEGIIKIQPLASIRGRSFNDTIFIVDEAQNLTPHEVKTIVTRAGENTTIIFCGDVSQIDSPYLSEYSNGLSYMISKMTGQYLFTHIILTKGERSELAELAANLL
jgi:PhoH-like ATPase